jgi:hypothetical protein
MKKEKFSKAPRVCKKKKRKIDEIVIDEEQEYFSSAF